MSNILLATNNRGDGAALSDGTWDATYVLNNLKDANISLPARSASAAITATRFRFDLGASYALRVLDLAHHTMSTSAQWRVRLGTAPLDLDFTREVTDSRLTISGGANGTRVNSVGLIVAATAPRFDYNPATLAINGLLIEEARTNLLLWCRDLTNAAWVKTSVTAVKTATGADGVANSASTITATAGNGTVLQTMTSASAARASTAWVRRRTGTGTVQMTQDNGVTWTAIALTGAWTRVTIPSQTVTNPVFGFRLVTSGDAIDVDYCQLETAAVPTSAIATTSAAVTRTAEVVQIAGATLTAFFSATQGTLYAEYTSNYDSSTALFPCAVSLSDGTANNRMIAYAATSSDATFADMTTGGVLQSSLSAGTLVYGTPIKTALVYNANDFAYCAAGGAVQTDVAGTVPAVTQLDIGRQGTGANYLNGAVRRLVYWPARLTNTQLQTITSSGPDAVGYDSGYVNVLRLTFNGDAPASWGQRGYNALLAFDAVTARYGTVEINDTANAAGFIDLGRLFVGTGLQPAVNASYDNYADGRRAIDTFVEADSGKKFGTARKRPKTTVMSFEAFTQIEADTLHELQDWIGLVGEVVFVPDPADMAASQRYGGLGYLSELSPIQNIFVNRRATNVKWEEKL